jgi:hypothetical protein
MEGDDDSHSEGGYRGVWSNQRKLNVNLKTLGGEIMMYKRRSMRRKNTTNVYITTGVMKTYRSIKKPEETQRKL